jgi:hypothetical protein
MFVNKMIIISTLPIGATATTINFSLTTDSELAGQSELETEFVDKEVEKSNKSNPDYEKTRFFTSRCK